MRISRSQDPIVPAQEFPICKTCITSVALGVLIVLGMLAKCCVSSSDFQGRNNGETIAYLAWSLAGLFVIGIVLEYLYSNFFKDKISIPAVMIPYCSREMQNEYNPV